MRFRQSKNASAFTKALALAQAPLLGCWAPLRGLQVLFKADKATSHQLSVYTTTPRPKKPCQETPETPEAKSRWAHKP